MEKNINKDETKLFDLIESKDFSELTRTEILFVKLHISMEDYNLQRRILKDSASIFENDNEPLPLLIPVNMDKRKNKTIPLYQALLAVASVCIFFFTIWPSNNQENSTGENFISSIKPDEIIQKEYIHDTIVKYVNQVKIVEKVVIDTVKELVTETKYIMQDNRLLEANNSLPLPRFNQKDITTKGISLKEDQSSRFIIPLGSFN